MELCVKLALQQTRVNGLIPIFIPIPIPIPSLAVILILHPWRPLGLAKWKLAKSRLLAGGCCLPVIFRTLNVFLITGEKEMPNAAKTQTNAAKC